MRLAGADADVLPLVVRYARILVAGPDAMWPLPITRDRRSRKCESSVHRAM